MKAKKKPERQEDGFVLLSVKKKKKKSSGGEVIKRTIKESCGRGRKKGNHRLGKRSVGALWETERKKATERWEGERYK